MPTFERVDGQTPHGGAYYIAYFHNADNEPCKKEDATSINIVEYDKNDKRIFENYLVK